MVCVFVLCYLLFDGCWMAVVLLFVVCSCALFVCGRCSLLFAVARLLLLRMRCSSCIVYCRCVLCVVVSCGSLLFFGVRCVCLVFVLARCLLVVVVVRRCVFLLLSVVVCCVLFVGCCA